MTVLSGECRDTVSVPFFSEFTVCVANVTLAAIAEDLSLKGGGPYPICLAPYPHAGQLPWARAVLPCPSQKRIASNQTF